nr:MAG TPA: PadR-family transcriptional regulator [Caudoviricetes sp.]
MKYTIFGFSQEQVLNLCDEHQSIDERDLLLLRWIMDFYFGGMEKLVIDGVEYGWVNASYVCDELPIMHLNPEAVRRRLKKLVKFGLLYHQKVKNSEVGTRAYYRPTEQAVQLQSDTRITSKCDGGATSKCDPVPLQSSNKDSSISDPSIINQPIKCDKPSQKRETSHKYGEYSNVLLSDTDLAKLKSEFPNDWEERIERLSAYMASTGKGYKNHLATIRNWARRDSESQSKRAGRNEPRYEKTEEEKQDDEAWMKNIIMC